MTIKKTTIMTNVSFKDILNATVHADNSSDTGRTADVSADVQFSGREATGFINGIAQPTGSPGPVCQFSESRGHNLSLTFIGYPDAVSRLDTLRAVDAFIAGVRDFAPSILGMGSGEDNN